MHLLYSFQHCLIKERKMLTFIYLKRYWEITNCGWFLLLHVLTVRLVFLPSRIAHMSRYFWLLAFSIGREDYDKCINWRYCLKMSNVFSALESVIYLIRSLAPSSEALSCNKNAGVSFCCLDFNKLAIVFLLLSQHLFS